MAQASGRVLFSDGLVMWCQYQGTMDVFMGKLYDTQQEMEDHWRESDYRHCQCGREEEIEAWTNYGDGSYYKGKACRFCKSLDVNTELGSSQEIERDWAGLNL
jgi:hypothetical protein